MSRRQATGGGQDGPDGQDGPEGQGPSKRAKPFSLSESKDGSASSTSSRHQHQHKHQPITILSYNVLGDKYADHHAFPYADPTVLVWKNRRDLILAEIQAAAADIVCLQEVQAGPHPSTDHRAWFADALCGGKGSGAAAAGSAAGVYDCHFAYKGMPKDMLVNEPRLGVMLLWRRSRFAPCGGAAGIGGAGGGSKARSSFKHKLHIAERVLRQFGAAAAAGAGGGGGGLTAPEHVWSQLAQAQAQAGGKGDGHGGGGGGGGGGGPGSGGSGAGGEKDRASASVGDTASLFESRAFQNVAVAATLRDNETGRAVLVATTHLVRKRETQRERE
jgi:hypothetical protein